jgi:integrase/recombinase XerD
MRMKYVYNRRKYVGKPALVELEMYFNRNERKYLSTGISLQSCQWSGDCVTNKADSNQLNRALSQFKSKYEEIIHAMEVDGVVVNLDNFNSIVCPKQKKESDSFLDFMYSEISQRNIRETTREQHFIAYNTLVRFGKIKSFASLTPQSLQEFDDFLRKDNPGRTQVTIHGYHKRIKPYVIKAYKLGYIEFNPYLRFTDVRGSSKERQPLTQGELDKLQKLILTDKLDKTRDLFVFACYTGLAYADLESFNYEKEVVESNGMKFIDGKRFKTGTEFYTPILPPAMKVLEKYHLKLPKISNQKYNDYLHVIETRLGLNKPLTSHVARHTFATTVALAHDVPIESVSKMLGHKDIKTTQIYAKVLKSTVERNVMQKML